MNRCKGCVYWKWVKADKLYQTPGYHYCEKNKETTCKRRAGEKEHYRITIDVIAEPDGVNRCSDIDHVVYLNKNELVPWTVRAEDVKYKVELLSDEADGQAGKDLALSIDDIEKIHTFLYAIKNNKHGAFTFTRLSDEQYKEVLRRFKAIKEEKK